MRQKTVHLLFPDSALEFRLYCAWTRARNVGVAQHAASFYVVPTVTPKKKAKR